MKKPLALVLDDEPDIRELLTITLDRMGIQSKTAQNLSEAKALLKQHQFNLCLTDLQLPDGNGLELVEHIQTHAPYLPTAVITAYGSMETAIQALKLGAFDFITKPIDLTIFKNLVNSAITTSTSTHQHERRSRDQLLGDSPEMRQVRSHIAKLARNQAPVFIGGDSGTGKELVAKLIHEKGPRAEHAFVPINCGAIPEALLESELFGHLKGSFTGALSNKQGLFQLADNGTLFLDEIGDLPIHMQVKLLRAIQEKSIRPIGSGEEISVDIRILSASHKNLDDLVQKGEFRQDLYYRINVIEVNLPSLQERTNDIPELAIHILNNIASNLKETVKKLSPSAMTALSGYDFPGNVRELENILERACAMSTSVTIDEQGLMLPIASAGKALSNPQYQTNNLENNLGTIEKETIMSALEKNRWNKTATAKELGITYRALRYRLEKMNIE
jgi:two-component system response regulator PilR (NtrC family)